MGKKFGCLLTETVLLEYQVDLREFSFGELELVLLVRELREKKADTIEERLVLKS